MDAGGRIGISDLLKQLVRLRLPVTTDQKAANTGQREIRHIEYFDDAAAEADATTTEG